MNASQALSIIAAIEQAARAGFTITIGPTLVNPGRILVQIAPTVVTEGKATYRVKKFTVVKDSARDALGNALGVTTLEIGLDESEEKRLSGAT